MINIENSLKRFERLKELAKNNKGCIEPTLYECEIETIINVLEKQIPYKPKEYEDKYYSCKCGNVLLMKWEKYPTNLKSKSEGFAYCLCCGQKLDWS